jgi:Animal haem peroxidase
MIDVSLTLQCVRAVLHLNLIDVPQPEGTELDERLKNTKVPLAEEDTPMSRTGDAFGNDRAHPQAGSYLAAIGRQMGQIPRKERDPAGDPAPQLVAQKLLARTDFKPAQMQLNLMAGAWIQAMIHDWQVRARVSWAPLRVFFRRLSS